MDDFEQFLMALRNEVVDLPLITEMSIPFAILNDPDWQTVCDALDPYYPDHVLTPTEAFVFFQRGLAAIRRHIPQVYWSIQ